MHPITRARAFRPFALNAVFRSVTIIGLANVSSRILECLSVCESKKGYSSSASARPLYLQPLIRLPLMFQASHFEPSFCQRDEAAHSRERSFQRRSSMRHVTIILNNLPTKEYKVDSYVNAYPLFSRPIPPLPLLPIRDSSSIVFFRSAPSIDLDFLSLSLSSFSLASYFAFPVSFLLVLLFFAALFLSNFRLSFGYVTPYVYVLCLLLLLRCCVLSFSLFSFFVVLSVFEWFCFHKYDFNHFVFSFSMYLSKICCVSWFIYVFPCHFYAILFILSV